MKLYFVRHGQSTANLTRIHCGWMTCPLTDLGREQAHQASRILQGITFEKVYSSDLPRALETASLVAPNQYIEPTSLIREINVGILQERTVEACTEAFGENYVRSRAALNYTAFQGESYVQLSARMKTFLDMVATQYSGNVLAVSHAHAINTVLNTIYQSSMGEMAYIDNCGICVFEYENQNWKLLRWNAGSSL